MSFSAPIDAIGGAITSGLGFATKAGQSAIGPDVPTGTSGVGIPTGNAYAIANAASKYGVPISILVGVFGIESDFGRNHATSSAGAEGPFQFLPSTAATYHYPLTDYPDAQQFQQQADSTAEYLSVLFKQTGSWDQALQDYSGHGYGLAEVQSKANQAPSALQSILNSTGFTPTAIGQGTDATTNALSSIGSFIGDLTNPKLWLRIALVIGGAVLITVGLIQLAKRNSGGVLPVPV